MANILKLLEADHGAKAMFLLQIYRIRANIRASRDESDKSHLHVRRLKWTEDVIEAVRALVEKDKCMMVVEL